MGLQDRASDLHEGIDRYLPEGCEEVSIANKIGAVLGMDERVVRFQAARMMLEIFYKRQLTKKESKLLYNRIAFFQPEKEMIK